MKKRNYSIPAHPYHLVDVSPWPILMSFGVLSLALVLVSWLTLGENNIKMYGIVFLNIIFISYQWLKDVVREGLAGFHTQAVREGLMLGFVIFLITEVLLFASFFWAFFHSSLNPSVELAMWPPLGVNAISCWSLPLLNSLLLLSSGFIITWAHHAFLTGNKTNTLLGMLISIILIIIFIAIQYVEYSNAEFSISDSVFGSVFFVLTGLHGLHVIAAIFLLSVSFIRVYTDQLTSEHCLGLDVSILYFHFTDIIWLLLYLVVYYWGG
jgi:cytochrome c oxidase subunit 3